MAVILIYFCLFLIAILGILVVMLKNKLEQADKMIKDIRKIHMQYFSKLGGKQ